LPPGWAHARRKFFDLAQINKAPIAIEAVERFHVLFAIEREINGMTPQERGRNERSWSLVIEAAGRLSSKQLVACHRTGEVVARAHPKTSASCGQPHPFRVPP
jgi:hypothetical protein